jgi:adenylate cyclase class 2
MASEKEIKIQIKDITSLDKVLVKLGAKFIGSAFQRTIRFDTPAMDLEKQGKFLRVRSGFDNVITLKVKSSNKKVYEREETEFEVGNIESARKVFNTLGFTKELIMEKYRSNWQLYDAVISIDELPFGFFVEIEAEEDQIFKVAGELGLDINKKIIESYWGVFEKYKSTHKKENLGESIIFPQGYKPKTSVKK